MAVRRWRYLEQLVAQNTGGSRYMQAPTLHTGLPAVPTALAADRPYGQVHSIW